MMDNYDDVNRIIASHMLIQEVSNGSVVEDLNVIYYLFQYGQFTKNKAFIERGNYILEHYVESSCVELIFSEDDTLGLRSKYLSLGIILNLLIFKGHIKRKTFADFLDKLDRFAKQCLEYNIDRKNLELLYGNIGVMIYLFRNRSNLSYSSIDEGFISKFFRHLTLYKDGLYFNNEFINKLSNQKVDADLGMAHGLCAVLKLASDIYELSESNILYTTIRKIVRFYREVSFQSSNKVSIFGDYYNFDSPTEEYSRLAWCNGDLIIGYTLLRTSMTLKDTELKNWATSILASTTRRVSQSQTGVVDPFFCHGSSGISYIYNKCYQLTFDKIYLDASEFWIRETRNQLKNIIAKQPPERLENSLLNGLLGIGLTFLSYATNDYSWDHILMLD